MIFSISKTYEVITPESAEVGDAEDRGFEWEGREFTFRDLVKAIKYDGYSETSSWPLTEAAARKHAPWITTEGDTDYRTGAETRYSLHLDDDQNPRARRYWAKALRFAGLVKP